jgi:ribonuclease R
MNEERRAELTEDLPEIARHTSERERRANEAERELVQWKKVRFMADKVGDEFEGYVTGVSAFGLYLELIEHFVEGMVHVSTMADDYYRFVERAHLLRGEKNGRIYRLGDRVKVQVLRVDLEKRLIDLGLSEILDAVSRRGDGRSPRSIRRPDAREAQRPRQGGRPGGPRPQSGSPRDGGRPKAGRPGPRQRAFRKAAKKKGR